MRIMKAAAVRPRWGSPRIHVLLRREGWLVTTSGRNACIAWKARI